MSYFRSLSFALAAAVPAVPLAADMKSVSGGVGIEARERMLRFYGEYNLHLAFATLNGEFLVDVALAIRGANGSVLWRALAEGPYYFARLPEGRYQVTAEFGGRSQTRWIDIGSAPGKIHFFHWREGQVLQ